VNKEKTRAGILKSTRQGWVRVVTPFDRDFVDDLKVMIPRDHRQWVPEDKHWLVNELFIKELVDIVRMHFDDVETDLGQKETIETTEGLFNQLFKVIPKDHVDKIYKILAQALHPDHGGSTEQMTELNKAYQEVIKK
jgi:hypothetical protein